MGSQVPCQGRCVLSCDLFHETCDGICPPPHTHEFFTVYTKLAEMALLASTGLRTPKKSYLQWDSTWCQGLLLVYESNTKPTEPLRHLLLRISLNFCPCSTWFLDTDHLESIEHDYIRILKSQSYKQMPTLQLLATLYKLWIIRQTHTWTRNEPNSIRKISVTISLKSQTPHPVPPQSVDTACIYFLLCPLLTWYHVVCIVSIRAALGIVLCNLSDIRIPVLQ